MFLCFFLRQGGEIVNRLLRKIADWTTCSLTTLEHCVMQGNLCGCSRQTSTPPYMSTPLHPPKCSPVAEVCDKVPRTTSFPVLLCPDRLCHTYLTMDLGIWSSSQTPTLFSAILAIFHVGSPILTIAASHCKLSTGNSHVGGIICIYHHAELLSEMMLH
jgi:hypothetical protein